MPGRLGRRAARQGLVFLDLKFWIALGEVALGRDKGNSRLAFLALLRGLVAAGKVFCPTSDSALIEIFKQSFASTSPNQRFTRNGNANRRMRST